MNILGISAFYHDSAACLVRDGEILAVGVLTGAFVFLADLVRHLDRPASVGFLKATSYRDGTRPGALDIELVGALDLAGRDVLLVEDIVDTGLTLDYIRHLLLGRHPVSLKIVTLLDKKERRRIDVPIDYVGFTIPDAFVIGYGLDYQQKYAKNLRK